MAIKMTIRIDDMHTARKTVAEKTGKMLHEITSQDVANYLYECLKDKPEFGVTEVSIPDPKFICFYKCDTCDENWTQRWAHTCNDKCPSCNVEIEPWMVDDVDDVDN